MDVKKGIYMSVSLLFEFKIVKREQFNSVNLIECFLKQGWSLYSEKGKIIIKQ